jgi:hypothetical protein
MDLTKNWKLNRIEVENLYRDCLENLISKNALHDSIKLQLIKYARDLNFKAINLINNLLLANSGTTFEYWTDKYSNYTDSQKIINWLTEPEITQQIQQINNPPPQQTETKTDKLKFDLGNFGFFELPKVKQLSELNKQKLIEIISKNDIPYIIAMFEYLGFLKYLEAEHFSTKEKLFKGVAKWFGLNWRTIKGNINVLNDFSKESRERYTARLQKQTVQKNYEALK